MGTDGGERSWGPRNTRKDTKVGNGASEGRSSDFFDGEAAEEAGGAEEHDDDEEAEGDGVLVS